MQAQCVSGSGLSLLNHSTAEIYRSLCPCCVLDNQYFFQSCLLETQDSVLVIPRRPDWNRSASSYDGSDKSHRKQMWIARVVLFFKCNFLGQQQEARSISCVSLCHVGSENLQRQTLMSLNTLYIWLATGTEHSESQRGLIRKGTCLFCTGAIQAAIIIMRTCLAQCFLESMSQYHTIPR